jgi:hypothetical protein
VADAPLSLRATRAGVCHVDGPLSAHAWDNRALLDGSRGVLVWGTSDVERARELAGHAIRKQFGESLAARHPEPGRWRLFRTSEDRDELEWRPAADAAEPGVLFTAEEAPGG